MADPETPANNQGPVTISSSSSERAPIIYFDGASCFGHHNGAIQIELAANRSEERRVGKECRSRWSPYH